MAEALGVERSTVARWELGTQVPMPGIRRRLADVLTLSLHQLVGLLEVGPVQPNLDLEPVEAHARVVGLPVEAFYVPAEDPLRLAHEWLVEDTPAVIHTRSGRRVGATLATELEARVVQLRHLDDVLSGGALYPVVHTEFRQVGDVVDQAAYTEDIGRRLLIVLGELAQLAGWVSSDAGRHHEAQRVYLSGVAAARAATDAALTSQLLSSLAYQMATVGDPGDAVLLARSAAKGAKQATPVVRALLYERVAWAAARCQDRDGTRRALDTVDELYERRVLGIAEREWVYWLNRHEIDVMAGRCLIELGEPERAEPLLAAAIAAYPTGHAREIALYLSWLAESYARTGNLDAARATLRRARHAAAGVHSARLDSRIHEVACLA
ncbi:hypothetical protein Aglo01_38910 [Actinokineospora globicatena]|nr:hypothetical protein Aglo01_38910 [Actinokineospora globicatena]GLW86181.1 hypothetical protein Aglo02_38200 [Actinokineospora globicatena]